MKKILSKGSDIEKKYRELKNENNRTPIRRPDINLGRTAIRR